MKKLLILILFAIMAAGAKSDEVRDKLLRQELEKRKTKDK